MTDEELVKRWRHLKQQEEDYRKMRLETEEALVGRLDKSPDFSGTEKVHGLGVSYRLAKKVSAEDLLAAAESASISPERVSELFRTKYEINAKAWAEASDEEQAALSAAITTKPAKPSFTVLKDK